MKPSLKKLFIFILIFFLARFFVFADEDIFAVGEVLEIKNLKNTPCYSIEAITFKITSGIYRGEKIQVKNYLWDDENYNTYLKKEQKAVLRLRQFSEGLTGSIVGYYRQNLFFLMLFCFLALLFFIVGKRFLRVFLSIIVNLFLFIFFAIPFLKKGVNPVLVIGLFISVSVFLTLVSIAGFSRKMVSSFVGTIASVLIAGVLSFFIFKKAHITGRFFDGSRFIQTAVRTEGIKINFFLLAVSSVLISALGVGIDIAVSISSFLKEFSRENPYVNFTGLFKAGINVGSDILATMMNSVIFVFLGGALPILLTLKFCDVSYFRIMNYEEISALIIGSILASCVVVLTVPVTSFVSARFLKR